MEALNRFYGYIALLHYRFDGALPPGFADRAHSLGIFEDACFQRGGFEYAIVAVAIVYRCSSDVKQVRAVHGASSLSVRPNVVSLRHAASVVQSLECVFRDRYREIPVVTSCAWSAPMRCSGSRYDSRQCDRINCVPQLCYSSSGADLPTRGWRCDGQAR